VSNGASRACPPAISITLATTSALLRQVDSGVAHQCFISTLTKRQVLEGGAVRAVRLNRLSRTSCSGKRTGCRSAYFGQATIEPRDQTHAGGCVLRTPCTSSSHGLVMANVHWASRTAHAEFCRTALGRGSRLAPLATPHGKDADDEVIDRQNRRARDGRSASVHRPCCRAASRRRSGHSARRVIEPGARDQQPW
jgi:hypothetical protein